VTAASVRDALAERIARWREGRTPGVAHAGGHWGRAFSEPKWTFSHYTLVELENLGLSALHSQARHTDGLISKTQKGHDVRRYDAAPARTTATGQCACWSTPWLTEPKSIPASLLRPLLPTTSSSAPSEWSTSALTG